MVVIEASVLEPAVEKSSYAPAPVTQIVFMVDEHGNSGQDAYVLKTSNDVSKHSRRTEAKLSDVLDLSALEDGAVLLSCSEVTVGR